MAEHNDLGKWGEDVALAYLLDQGYRLLDRNWHQGHRDLDLIMQQDDTLVIVEVRTRRNNLFMDPEQTVDALKMLSLSKAANAYIRLHRISLNIRFDIVAITGTPSSDFTINHIEDAFYPPAIWR
ncbi:YraN family protein [Prevotella sp. P2-180]|uniref:YraN family protein n=1 Tax=Prevotella sp. P2-180 TaxID=2024224 RepID=UPI000B961D5A|nr:YraN family protein [Prevotella sp. P2-180]MCI6338650.1 YraN family protein [Prevotella sp.]MCI7089420.1 YraN family protein [Prevotella sp.]MCI7256783.1 YraN family protein [Prevotella sp.]MDD5783773.1 YraN family protein [Prevotella sp.]MDD6863156.1 YraN family protein [Prevotella sp.]